MILLKPINYEYGRLPNKEILKWNLHTRNSQGLGLFVILQS